MIILESLLTSLRSQVATLTLRSPIEHDVYPFMLDVLDLGLLVEAAPARRVEIRGFLDDTAAHLIQEFGMIRRFARDMISRSSTGWSDDPLQWEDLCNRRSALAFFAELYQDTALAPQVLYLGQIGLDQLMRDRSCHAFLDPSRIPAHMPTRHWWWWLPDDPPA